MAGSKIPAIKTIGPITTIGPSLTFFKTDLFTNGTNIGFGVVMSGTGTYSVQHTFDDIYDTAVFPNVTAINTSATWFNHEIVNNQTTATIDGNYAFPIVAVRTYLSAVTTAGFGGVTLNIIQTGIGNH